MLFNLFNRKAQSKKKKRNQKKEMSDEAKRLIRRIVIVVVLYVGLIFLIILGIFQISKYITGWDYFFLEHIEIRGENLSTKEAAGYCDIELPQNLIALDIDMLSRHIKKIHPDLKHVSVERKLPNTLIVIIDRRKPLVQVKLRDEYYLVDSEGFVIQRVLIKEKNAPVVVGLRRSEVHDLKNGICLSKKLRGALELFQLYKSIITEDTYKVETIDVSNSKNYILFLSKGLEIRFGRGSFESRMKNLLLILREMHVPDNSYIDLRFKNVTVAPKKI